jgi:hypothetical protein
MGIQVEKKQFFSFDKEKKVYLTSTVIASARSGIYLNVVAVLKSLGGKNE